MSRRSAERLEDVSAAIEAIRGHVARGEITDGLVFDAAVGKGGNLPYVCPMILKSGAPRFR